MVAEDMMGEGSTGDWFPRMEPFRTSYSPGNALWMARLSQAVYKRHENGDPDAFLILKELKQVDEAFKSVDVFNARSSQACVVAHEGYIAAVFRGTDEIADWLDNLNVVPVPGPFGLVHRGFREALMDVWPDMRQAIRALRPANRAHGRFGSPGTA